ncbi:MAG: cell division protein FtsZ, partial [Sphingomonas sp.]
ADVRSVMQEMGKAMMGTGEAEGDNRAIEAASKAIANPLLDGVSMKGAKGVIVSITGGEDMRLLEVDEAANHIRELVDEDANIIWGSAFNPELEGKIRVSVVATGIEADTSGIAAAEPTTRAFSFGRRSEAVAPVTVPEAVEPTHEPEVAAAADPVVDTVADDEPLELSAPVTEPMAEDGLDAPTADDDELVLDSGAEVENASPTRLTFGDEEFGGGATIAAGSDEETAAPKVKLGGTLFERMQNVARGAFGESEPEAEKDSLDIPRFLHRQNNQ